MKEEKRILITGAGGNLGGRLTKLLADETEYEVIAVSSFPEKIPNMLERIGVKNPNRVFGISGEEMFRTDLSKMNIAGAVHFAFSRAVFPKKDIASSLDYSLAAFRKIADSHIQNAIYISSQSVYGNTPEWRTEETVPSPESVYAMAKYAGEKLFEAVYLGHKELQHTILRLDIVIQSQNLVKTLCKNAKESGKLRLRGGKQVFSYMDADDVPYAILALLNGKIPWKAVYNVGPNKMRYQLMEIAGMVKEAAKAHGYGEREIDFTEDETALWAGMDTGKFAADTGWKPRYDIRQMIDRVFEVS